MTNQKDQSHNKAKPRGFNNTDPQAVHKQTSQDWVDARQSQDPDAPGGKRRFMHDGNKKDQDN